MGHTEPYLGDQVRDLLCHAVDGLHAVVKKEDLSPTVDFPQYRIADDSFIEPGYVGSDGLPARGWALNYTQITDAHQGHMKRSWDRSSGQADDVYQLT